MPPDKGSVKSRPVKRLLRRARRWFAGRLVVSCDYLFGSRGQNVFGILMYHRVAPWDGSDPVPSWNVTPSQFRAQLSGLLQRGYEAWPLRRVLAERQKGRPIPRKAFVVTFDDGYENVYTWAWPILRELRIPATVFLATAYLDSACPFPFDDWPLAGSESVSTPLWRPLTTAQCREMLESEIMDLGSHTHTHQVFRGRPETLHADLLTSLVALKRRFGLADATFGFPYGIADSELSAAVRDAGLLCGLTTRGGLVQPHSDPFSWGRFAVEEVDTASTIAAQLDGWGRLARKSWKRAEREGSRSSQENLSCCS